MYVRFYIGDATFHSRLLAHEEGFVGKKKNWLIRTPFVGVMCLPSGRRITFCDLLKYKFWLGMAYEGDGIFFHCLFFIRPFFFFFFFPFVVAKPREISKKAFP